MNFSSVANHATKRTTVVAWLTHGIESGRWPAGTLLPTEAQLCADLRVGRHTVRAALSDLRAQGLVAGRQGVGTRVLRCKPESIHAHSLQSISELALYARHTSVRLLNVDDVTLDQVTAEWLGVPADQPWCLARTLRLLPTEQDAPVALSSVWLPAMSRQAIDTSLVSGLPMFMELQRLHGRMVREVRQVIGVGFGNRAQAQLLQCRARDPLLRIQRWYYDDQHLLMEASDSLHPQDRFQYAVTLRHVVGAGVTHTSLDQEASS